MPVATPLQPDYTSQSGTAYPLAIDASIAAARRLAWAFAPHEQSTPNMTVRLEAGPVLSGVTLTEVAAQSTGTITAPTTNPRIDRVVVDSVTGAVSVITGTQAASPAPPAITAGKWPVAQVLLQTSSTAITNSMITDERVLPMPLTAAAIGAVATTGNETIAGNKTFSGTTALQALLDISHASAGQIKFPATQNASADPNTLDDYEEGTFTIGLSFGGGTTGLTFSSRTAFYIKIGAKVYVWFSFVLSNKGSSTGVARLTGFPFTIANSADQFGVQTILVWQTTTTALVNMASIAEINATTALILHLTAAATVWTSSTDATFANSTQLQASFGFRV